MTVRIVEVAISIKIEPVCHDYTKCNRTITRQNAMYCR